MFHLLCYLLGMDRNTIIKKKFDVAGMVIKNGSYFLMKSINGKRFSQALGRVEAMSKEEAQESALATIKKVKELGAESYKALGDRRYLLGHNAMRTSDVYQEFYEYVSTTGTKKAPDGFREESLYNYRNEVNQRWNIKLGSGASLFELPIDKITDDHIEVWFRQIEKIKKEDGSLKPVANFYSLTLLSRLFNWAKDRRYITTNPCERLVKSSERVTPQKRKTEEEERINIRTNELGRFLFALVHSQPKQKKRNNETTRDFILMALMTGSRDTELKHLKWSWFDDTTTFGSYIAPAKVTDEKLFQGTKGKREYYYACSQVVQAMLKKRYANKEKLATELGGKASLTYVFPNANGDGPIVNVRNRIKSICDYAGIDKSISMHSFRFTLSNIIEQQSEDGTSFPDRIVKAVIHHKDSSITARYIGDNDRLQIHKCFQHVEDFCSMATGVGVVVDIFSRINKITGVTGIGLDNKSIQDDRVTDPRALRNALYGDGKLQHKDIIEKEEIILKDLFPNLPKDWNKKTLVFNSMTKIKLKSLPKKAPDNPKEQMKYYDDLMQQEQDLIQSQMYERFKGQSLIFRSNLETLDELNKDAKALDKFKTKYPELHASLFSSEESNKVQ